MYNTLLLDTNSQHLCKNNGYKGEFKPGQTPKMELFAKIVKNFAKSSILDVRHDWDVSFLNQFEYQR